MRFVLLMAVSALTALSQPTILPQNPTVAIGSTVKFTTSAATPYWVIGGAGSIDAMTGIYTAPKIMPLNTSVPVRVLDFLAQGMNQTTITLVSAVAVCGACRDGKDGLDGKNGAVGPVGPPGPQGPPGGSTGSCLQAGATTLSNCEIYRVAAMAVINGSLAPITVSPNGVQLQVHVPAPQSPGSCPIDPNLQVTFYAIGGGFRYECDSDGKWGRVALQKVWQ